MDKAAQLFGLGHCIKDKLRYFRRSEEQKQQQKGAV